MAQVNIHEAKTHLSKLLARVQKGEVVVISKAGRPIAMLIAYKDGTTTDRVFGLDAGLFEIPEDFYQPLPSDVLDSFEQ